MRAVDHFTLCGTRLSILRYEGTVQLCFWDEALPQGKQKIIANRFADGRTAAELRAIADHLDRIGVPA